jgi:putative ABC transport system substrate-binding protein
MGGKKLLFAAALLCAAATAQAQSSDLRRVGILTSGTPADARASFAPFTERMRALGYAEGRNLAYEWRHAEGRLERLPVLAGELVKANVQVIVTHSNPTTAAAKRATGTVPIVSALLGDAVASGFAQSAARPGGNITGFSQMGGAIYEKRVELAAEAMPGAARIGLLTDGDNNFFVRILPGLEEAAKKRGRKLFVINAKDARTLEEGFGKLATAKAGAVIVGDDYFMTSQTSRIVALAARHRIPTVFPFARGAEVGGMFALENNTRYRYQATADYVDRILKGAKPGDLPIEQPVKLDLVVNKKAADALGIAVPQAVIARAGKVIQ